MQLSLLLLLALLLLWHCTQAGGMTAAHHTAVVAGTTVFHAIYNYCCAVPHGVTCSAPTFNMGQLLFVPLITALSNCCCAVRLPGSALTLSVGQLACSAALSKFISLDNYCSCPR
jgi:hypothetical protein